MAWQDSQPEDIHATLAVSEEEARLGGSRVINLPGGRSVTITVPAGVRDGEEIRLPGQGATGGADGVAGDLILRISVVTVEQFKNDLDDASITLTAYPTPPVRPSSEYAAKAFEPAMPASVPTEIDQPARYAPPPPVYPQTPSGGPQSYPGSYPNYPTPYPTYPPQQVPQQPNTRSGALTTVIALLVFLLLVGSGFFFYFDYYQPNQAHSAATATAQALTQATAHAQATGTARIAQSTVQAAATGTAETQATAAAQQKLYAQATSGTPALSDSLSSQTGHLWDESDTSSGSCKFTNGDYHSLMPTATFFQPCYAENSNFSNFTFQVDMAIIHGDEGGILFRSDNVNNKFYLFQIDIHGNYTLYLYINSHGSQAMRLLHGSTNFMKGLNQLNEITLVAQGKQFSFYLNKHFLAETNDATYASGKIGVFAESITQATDVAFTNAKVWTL